MSEPLPPDPSDRTSVRQSPAMPASGNAAPSANGKALENVPVPPPTTPAEESSPTVISSIRRPAVHDGQHAESLIGRRLGHFELIESVGFGGMATVIKAQDLDLGRIVALKILPPDMAADPDNITRFKQEGRAAARLDHENIARVYYCGEDQGLHFIAFEFVEGENLRVCMEEQGGLLPVAESLSYMMQVTAGLSHAASRGVVHRDIKPSNIIITPDGKAKIVDMGLARNLDPRTSNGQLTQSGVTLGTFDYISPEQAIDPRSADCRSDIYSLGCAFYHVMTGRTPVPEGTAAKKLDCHQHVAPLDPRELNPAIPDEVTAVLGKMMAKDPAQRYQHPDHLLQHLLIVAEKLNISTAVIDENGKRALPYVDQPLPSPPQLSGLWIGMAVAVLALGLFAISGGMGGGQSLDSTPFWQTDKSPKVPGPTRAKRDLAPNELVESSVAARGPQEAQSTAELVALLRQPNAQIKLKPGKVYDLTRVRKEAEPLAALFEGSELTLDCDRLLDPPTIRMLATAADDGQSPRFGSLTIRGPTDGSAAKVRFRGIRFEIVANDADTSHVGISVLNVEHLDVEECSFVPPLHKGQIDEGSTAFAIAQRTVKESVPEARFDRCWFAPGWTAVRLVNDGSQLFRASECAFGPQHAIVEVEGLPGVLGVGHSENRRVAGVGFESCSMLMTAGAVVELGDRVPCRVTAGWCLFSNPEWPGMATSQAFVIREMGALAPETLFEGRRLNEAAMTTMPNGYDKVLAYSNGDTAYTFDECKQQQVPVADAGARELLKHPWTEERPVRRLFDFPRQIKQTFAVDLKQEILRLEPDKNRNLLGTKHLPGMRVYDFFPFESPTPDTRMAANVKIWQPDFPADAKLPPNLYRSLVKAIDDLNKGDVLLIRHDGPLEMDPIEFKKPDTDVTIRPDEDYQPILIPKAPSLKKDAALIKLYGGQLTLENLRFRQKADRAPSIVTLPGGGQCIFRNCVATLEEGDDLAVVSLADPRGEMMMMGLSAPEKWPVPKIVLENTFIRGRGRALHVLGSRPFELRMKGCLAVLDGSLIGVEPSNAEHSEPLPAQATLEYVTTYLTKNVLTQRGADKRGEAKGIGLVQVQIHATNCLFAPAVEQAALVNLDHIDSMEQMDGVFQWKNARQNVYGFKPDQVMMLVQPENIDTAVRLERVVRDVWLGTWREADYAFGEVNFSVLPASKRFDGVKPSDFEVKSIVPPLKPDEPRDFGAPIDLLRKVAIEE